MILIGHVIESALLLAGTLAYVLPLLLARIAWEERVLREGFGDRHARYAKSVPALLPLPR